MERIELPRSLVTEVLHWATSVAGEEPAGVILDTGTGLQFQRLHGDTDPPTPRSSVPFAFVRVGADPDARPRRADLERWGGRTRLFFIVSLGTHGVLQLRGWCVEDGGIGALEIGIVETGEPPQPSASLSHRTK